MEQVAPALIKAEVPWSARRGSLSEKDRVLKTVKGYVLLIFLCILCASPLTSKALIRMAYVLLGFWTF